ncbi:hypothetical protein E2C01_022117 [Portunus trituberculatus]|uniref:Uncharacterized protein n=1 Tax=Portunus trituberculatus TaxID=210409 RepID=A0A5B7E818_PORTR|nr:hypothetical protein [Portunus trituberculatus]
MHGAPRLGLPCRAAAIYRTFLAVGSLHLTFQLVCYEGRLVFRVVHHRRGGGGPQPLCFDALTVPLLPLQLSLSALPLIPVLW